MSSHQLCIDSIIIKIWNCQMIDPLTNAFKVMYERWCCGNINRIDSCRQIVLVMIFPAWKIQNDLCPVHFIFRFSFFVSFGNEVTKVSCHFQAKTVQLIFSFFVILTKIRKTKIVMNRTIMSNTATLIHENIMSGSLQFSFFVFWSK